MTHQRKCYTSPIIILFIALITLDCHDIWLEGVFCYSSYDVLPMSNFQSACSYVQQAVTPPAQS